MKHLQQVLEGRDLSVSEAEALLGEVFNGATDAQIGALLVALKMKGEAVSEIAGLARAMRAGGVRIRPRVPGPLVDTCGTGGDGTNTINVSTAAAIVAASSGAFVAKHGNYAVSSACGSANVLAELGVEVAPGPERVCQAIETLGIGFMLAPVFHPSMKRVASIRRELATRTVFNILGPLTNPAGAPFQVMGVYDPRLCDKLALALKILGTERALVVHGSGLDEITNTGPTRISELDRGALKSYTVTPQEFGYPLARIEEIRGGSPEENAGRLVEILSGAKGPGRDVVAMNSGAALYVAGIAESLFDGARMAEESIDSGRALTTLKRLVASCGSPERLERFL
ncbi:anthranilate phosphoribosyltransferase [Methanothrix harundinacea]|uniref:Anthranilate phosphoribosyltransferase n=1 Tax=Methanothrix harundinacea (strain 6Ac) TaxID=1110509 RepID=G7WR34_METH6|nr:anthranilate phosphoribosyltransferase [Methanothrix harundinacea]AET65337.1 Anthranilate phosphoribosyltransferase [Methanothrix harundinacea 6Ac]